jgi:fucose permease
MWTQKNTPSNVEKKRITDYQTPILNTLKQPAVWLSMALFFLYVGAEISLGAWAYTFLTESRGIAAQIAGLLAGSYWGTFTIGRITAGLFSKKINSTGLISIGLSGALIGSVLLWWNPASWVNLVAVALIGFSIAPIFPALTSSTSQRVDHKHIANTIGMQMTASGLSGAVIPGMVGVLARRISLEIIPVCLVILFTSLLALFLIANRKGIPGTRF